MCGGEEVEGFWRGSTVVVGWCGRGVWCTAHLLSVSALILVWVLGNPRWCGLRTGNWDQVRIRIDRNLSYCLEVWISSLTSLSSSTQPMHVEPCTPCNNNFWGT